MFKINKKFIILSFVCILIGVIGMEGFLLYKSYHPSGVGMSPQAGGFGKAQASPPVIGLASTTAPSSVSNKLYANGGQLFWSGVPLTSSSGTSPWIFNNATDIYNKTGNVGVGTTSPNTLFTIQGTAGNPILNIASSTGTSVLYVNKNGNVGINYTNSSYPLSFGQSVGNKIALYDSGVDANQSYGLGLQANVLQIFAPSGSTNRVGIGIGNSGTFSEILSVKTGGTVGVSSSSPSNVFSVNGDSYLNGRLGLGINSWYGSSIAQISSSSPGALQFVLGNTNNTATASTDFIVQNNLGSDNSYYGDFGINSAANTDINFTAMSGNTGYLYFSDADLVIGTASSSKNFYIITGGTLAANKRMTITSTGYVGIGTTTPIVPFQVTTPSSNSTTTMELGKVGQTKGGCFKTYNTAGTATWCFINGTTWTCSASSCQ